MFCLGNEKLIRLLGQTEVDWNVTNDEGKTLVYVASSHGFDQIVELLAEQEVDLNTQNNDRNFTPLLIAVHNGIILEQKF